MIMPTATSSLCGLNDNNNNNNNNNNNKHRVSRRHKERCSNPVLMVETGEVQGNQEIFTRVVNSLLPTFTHEQLFLGLLEDSPLFLSSDLLSTLYLRD